MPSAFSPLRRLTRRSRAIIASAALATCLTAMLTAGATAAPTTTMPAGGSFEATPLLYTTSGTAGALAKVTSSQAAETDGNHYLQTLYSTVLGVLGTNSATATITSPSFEFDQATPSAVAFSFERRSTLSGVLDANVAVAWSARLANESSGVTTMLSSQTITESEALHTISVPVAPATLIAGDTYRLAITEEYSSLLDLIQSSSVDLDNVGLNVTAALAPPVLGAATLGTPSEHGVTATTTIDPNDEATTYDLQYGTTPAHSSTGPQETIPVGSSGSRQASSTITGLAPGTLYYVRFAATNEDGTSYGPETTFTTAAATPPSGGEGTTPGGGTSGGSTGGETGGGTSGSGGTGSGTDGSGTSGGGTNGSSTTGSTTSDATGTSSGTTTGSSTTGGSTTAGTGSSASGAGTPAGGATCLRVATVRRGRAVRFLSIPASAEVSAGHPLRVALTARAGHPRSVRYSLGGATLASASRAHSVLIAASQLRAGHKTVLQIVVSPAKGAARSLRVTITATACGARFKVTRKRSRRAHRRR
jgi:hypothetical protein